MSCDQKAWTSDKPDPSKWYWFDAAGIGPHVDCRSKMSDGFVRSALPIPSAERIAALEEVAEIVCNNRNDPDHMAFLLDAAIERLEASRG